MPSKNAWSGWIAFAGLLMIVIGFIDFFEGLIAVIRKEYYVATPSQIIVFNVSTWGWLTLLWGVVIAFVGLGLLSGAGWARWVSIVVVSDHVPRAARLRRQLLVPAHGARGADADA